MNVDLRGLGKGSYDIGVGLTSSDIDALVAGLQALKERRDHFHLRGDYSAGGVEDIEFYWQEHGSPSNMTVDTSPPIEPTR